MKKIIIVLSVLVLFSCEKWEKKVKHIKSDLSGLNRKITLFAVMER